MLRIVLAEMLDATGATLLCGDATAEVRGVTTDSRAVTPGCVFVCFAGERVDGNRFAPQAVEAGAGAVVLTAEATGELLDAAARRGCAVLRAAQARRVEASDEVSDPDATEFLLRLAALWRARNPHWLVVGVTGSVGKTTTKDMLAAGLAPSFATHATKGNFNNLVGAPLTLLAASEGDEVVVAEMGMNHAGELALLAEVVRPTLACITNVGTSHIGNLGSREAIARAKAEIVEGMAQAPDSGVRPCLVLTDDNDFADLIERSYCAPAGVEVLRVGTAAPSAVRAEGIALDGEGRPSFELAFADGWHQAVTLDAPGRHVVSDFLIAMALVERAGADRAAAAHAIAHMPVTRMRLEVLSAPGRPRVIDDSYNASPSSVAAALDVLCAMDCCGRRVAVLGEVGELGGASARLHGYMGAYAAAKPLDLLVLVGGDGAAEMAEAARTMGFSEDRLELLPSCDCALEVIGPVLREGDLVLVKGSRFVGLDVFAKGVLA